MAVTAAIAPITDPEAIEANEMIAMLERANHYVKLFRFLPGATGTRSVVNGLSFHISTSMTEWRGVKLHKWPTSIRDNYDFGAEFRDLVSKWNKLVALTVPHVQHPRRAKHAKPAKRDTAVRRLVAYRTTVRLNDRKFPAYIVAMYQDFERRVAYLNKQLDLFSAWFPYPSEPHHSECTPTSQGNKCKHQQMTQDTV